jgi:hypothetical protein
MTQPELQWLQDTSKVNGDNLKNKRCEGSKHFKNKRREYLEGKIDELSEGSCRTPAHNGQYL